VSGCVVEAGAYLCGLVRCQYCICFFLHFLGFEKVVMMVPWVEPANGMPVGEEGLFFVGDSAGFGVSAHEVISWERGLFEVSLVAASSCQALMGGFLCPFSSSRQPGTLSAVHTSAFNIMSSSICPGCTNTRLVGRGGFFSIGIVLLRSTRVHISSLCRHRYLLPDLSFCHLGQP